MTWRRLRSSTDDDHGAAAVELALVLPIVILLLGGIVDFGFAFNAQISATHAAREGVRAAALEQDDPEGVAAAAFSAPVATASPNLTSACGAGAEQARMEVTATYEPFFPFLNTMNLESEAVMRCGG